MLYPGDFIGELSIFLDEDNTAYAEAMTHVELCTIKKEDISKLMMDYPNIGMKIINELSQRLKRSEKQSSWIATEQVEKRLALYLLELYDKNNTKQSIHLNITKKHIATFKATPTE